MQVINIYSDEANHLRDPKQGNFMVIGSVWCNRGEVSRISDAIRKVKEYHGLPRSSEIKWTKISASNQALYLDIIRLFFSTDLINFRAVVVPKDQLDHELYRQSDDEFYYKTQYLMVTNIVVNHKPNEFRIYIDYKDSWSHYRSKKLEQYLSNKTDFSGCVFKAQPVRSDESELIQLADVLIGATSYRNNHYDTAPVDNPKRKIVESAEELAMQRLNQSSPRTSEKINIFMLWKPKDNKA